MRFQVPSICCYTTSVTTSVLTVPMIQGRICCVFPQDSSKTIDQMEHPPQLFLSLCKQQACTNPVYKSQSDLEFGNTKLILDQAVNSYFDLHSNDFLQRASVKSYVSYMGI